VHENLDVSLTARVQRRYARSTSRPTKKRVGPYGLTEAEHSRSRGVEPSQEGL
jgi:hypothetical protein